MKLDKNAPNFNRIRNRLAYDPEAAMKQRWKAGGSKKVRVVKSKGAA
jgi:hypothetical protein